MRGSQPNDYQMNTTTTEQKMKILGKRKIKRAPAVRGLHSRKAEQAVKQHYGNEKGRKTENY